MVGDLVRASTLAAPEVSSPPLRVHDCAVVRRSVVQLSGTAALSGAIDWCVRMATDDLRPCGWVGGQTGHPFPPDIATAGLALNRLLSLATDDGADRMHAADRMLRSGQFALVCVDLAMWRQQQMHLFYPMAGTLSRFMRICEHRQTTVMLITPGPSVATLSPAVRLHVEVGAVYDGSAWGQSLEWRIRRSRTACEGDSTDVRRPDRMC